MSADELSLLRQLAKKYVPTHILDSEYMRLELEEEERSDRWIETKRENDG